VTDALEAAFQELRREYLAEAAGRLAELRKDAAAFLAGEADAAESLLTRFHRLTGSGGSYGFPEVSVIARENEQWLAAQPELNPAAAARLERAIEQLQTTFDRAAIAMGPPEDAVRPPEFGWRALLEIDSAALRAQVTDELSAAGFTVRHDVRAAGLGALAPCERPDLVVIASERGPEQAYAATAAWNADRRRRPRGIVLLEGAGALDHLRAVAAGADVVFGLDQIGLELPRYGQSLSRIGSPPLNVLFVDADNERARKVMSRLDEAGLIVERVASPADAQQSLGRTVPDVLLVTVTSALMGHALARFVRQEPRTRLVPVIVLCDDTGVPARTDALRAGVDDLLPLPPDPDLVLQTVVARGERGRQLSELVHRDPLTGLLNFATLRTELEHAVAYAHRYNDRFAFVMFDVDHFRRINERHGHLVGDRVLVHVAGVLRSAVRASDLLARHGGEEFAMILRGAGQDGALIAAEKLREALRARPFATRQGGEIPLNVSVGVAAFGPDGGSAGELAQAADRALHRAKLAGRNRVEVGGQ
jgi:diguanylate cyclase (GGDEF)-like protein